MKKIASIAVIALFAFGFTSCKKDYACECKITSNGVATTVTGASAKMKKGEAEDLCNKGDMKVDDKNFTECTAVSK